MRHLLLLLAAASLAAVPAEAVTPFSWNIVEQSSPTKSTTVPAGMVWVVEQVTGFESSARTDAPVAGVATAGAPSGSYHLLLGPSSISHFVVSSFTYYHADYSRSLTARLSGDLIARGVNGNILPERLVLSGYLTPTLAGDYSGDGVVNAADYTVLRDNARSWELSDMSSWRSSYGAGSSSSVAVPEASAAAMAAIAILAFARRHTNAS